MQYASPIVEGVGKSIVDIVAANAKAAFAASRFDSYRSLGKAAGVAPNTVKYLIEPHSRPPGPRGEVSPRLDVLDHVAKAMGYDGWALMQENFDPQNPPKRILTKREAELYRSIEDAYRNLPPDMLAGRD